MAVSVFVKTVFKPNFVKHHKLFNPIVISQLIIPTVFHQNKLSTRSDLASFPTIVCEKTAKKFVQTLGQKERQLLRDQLCHVTKINGLLVLFLCTCMSKSLDFSSNLLYKERKSLYAHVQCWGWLPVAAYKTATCNGHASPALVA